MPAELQFPSEKAIYQYLKEHPKTKFYFKGNVEKDPIYLTNVQIIKQISKRFANMVIDREIIGYVIKDELFLSQQKKNRIAKSISETILHLKNPLKDCGAGVPMYIIKENCKKEKRPPRDLSGWDFLIW